MVRSMLVGVDGSAYSAAAVDLGIRWAQRCGAVLVGLGIIDAPTIRKSEPVPLGGSAYKVQRDASLMADAHRTVAQFLEHCARRCAEAGVACQVQQEVGLPSACLLLEAQRYDLLLLGQHTYFHFETQAGAGETLSTVLKQSPRPVVTVPTTLPAGQAVVVAYDGSLQAARALQAFQALGPGGAQEVHVVCVKADQAEAVRCAARAVDFLRWHDIAASPHALATTASPAEVLLEHVRQVEASLLVMGAYGQPTLREFVFGSVTRTLLQSSPVPLFLTH